jgi:hypothetical protein
MNCQWQVHFETLRPSAFQAIGDCGHGHFFPESISADQFPPINEPQLYRGSNRPGSCKAVTPATCGNQYRK